MSDAVVTIKSEQAHFDRAWDERERARNGLMRAGDATAGPRSTTTMVRAAAKKHAENIAPDGEAVAFGRFDALDGGATYVGKNSITTQDADVLVVNWQAPAAQDFYRANMKEPRGVAMKRNFATTRNRIDSFEDIFFADLAHKVENLTKAQRINIDDALLTDLERTRSDQLQDIVRTIHHSQYGLIELPLDRLLVIQGGPGTGKTAVILHRVSWLLFNDSSLEAEDVLVVGPNSAFTKYISHVLPTLGDRAVNHIPMTELGPVPSTRRNEPLEVASLKGQQRMAGLLSRALRDRVRFPNNPISVETNVGRRQLERDPIIRYMKRLVNGSTGDVNVSYLTRRASLRNFLETQVSSLAFQPTPIARSVDSALERLFPNLSPARFLQELLASRQGLLQAAGDDFTAGDIERLYRPSAANLGSEEWSDADVALLDEAAWLLQGGTSRFQHIVVDEAQDLSPMQLRSLARRSANGSFTVAGDIAQSTGPWARSQWDEVVDSLGRHGVANSVQTLEYGYRVPKEVYAVAAPLLPIIAPGLTAPEVIRDAPSPPSFNWVAANELFSKSLHEAKEHAGLGRFVGVICPSQTLEAMAEALREAKVQFGLVSSGGLGPSINLMTADESKGLEFDTVVVCEPAAIAKEGPHGLRHLYIALTRTTKYLSVVYNEPLPEIGLAASGADLVEVAKNPEPLAGQGMSESNRIMPHPYVEATRRPSPRSQMLVDAMAEGLAAEVQESLAPAVHEALLEALAARLGFDTVLERIGYDSRRTL